MSARKISAAPDTSRSFHRAHFEHINRCEWGFISTFSVQSTTFLLVYFWGGGARGEIHQRQVLAAHFSVHVLSIPTYRCKRYLINARSAETVESLLVCFWVGVSAKNKATPDTSRTLPREDFERTCRCKWCLISTSSVQPAEFLLV